MFHGGISTDLPPKTPCARFTFLDAPHEAEPFPDATGDDAEANAAEGGHVGVEKEGSRETQQ